MSELLADLEAAIGSECVRSTELSLLGARIQHEVAPRDAEALARALGILNEHKSAAVVRGGGTHDELGNSSRPVSVALSTRHIEGVEEFDEQDGVIRVRAGTRIAALRSQVEAQRWELGLDTSGLSAADDATVGGTLASGAFGARRLGYGPPRDTVLGLDVALASGERTRCGARVVKNVTGYDLQKLYCGSFGTLGVMEAAWLRLRPMPERVATLFAPVDDPKDPVGAALGIALSRRSTARCVAIVDDRSAASIGLIASNDAERTGFTQVAEFAGSSAAVDDDVAWSRARCQAAPAASGVVEAVAALPHRGAGSADASGERVAARFSVLPSALSRCVGELQARGATIVAHPGLGLVHAFWEVESASTQDVRGIVRGAVDVAARVRATLRFERLAVPRREGSVDDVFGTLDRGELHLMRALKNKFDPAGILNPGRAAGHL